MDRYTLYKGVFNCQFCNLNTHTIRHYPVKKELTWMCTDKHLSIVSLTTKKSKKDYEREI
jgi:hypothetical protein